MQEIWSKQERNIYTKTTKQRILLVLRVIPTYLWERKKEERNKKEGNKRKSVQLTLADLYSPNAKII